MTGPAGTTIGAAFTAAARRYAARPAIIWAGGLWTYARLEDGSRSWCARFARSTDSQGRPIAIALPRGPELVAAILGAAMAGRPWTVLQSSAPDRPARETLEAIGSCDVVSPFGPPTLETLTGGLDIRAVRANAESGTTTSGIDLAPSCAAAICFTSGSTGRPKGVVMRHDASVWNAERAAASLGIDPDDRYLWVSSPGSAASCTAIFSTLLTGACLLPFDVADRGLFEMAAFAREHQATVLHAIPSLVRLFVRSIQDPSDLRSLRVVKLGGEHLFASDIALFRERLPSGTRLVNGLGLSEANGNVCHESISPDAGGDGVVPVGASLPGFDLSLHDPSGADVANGEPGRLRIVSASLAEGYWDRDLGRAVPFPSLRPGSAQRVFESQDRCRRLADGRFVHLGRSDGVAKIRGKRVSLVDVETRLRALPEVAQVVVDAAPDAQLGSSLTAWVELLPGSVLTLQSVRMRLLRAAPPEAVPTRLFVLDKIPLLPGGKVDRRRLLEEGRTNPA